MKDDSTRCSRVGRRRAVRVTTLTAVCAISYLVVGCAVVADGAGTARKAHAGADWVATRGHLAAWDQDDIPAISAAVKAKLIPDPESFTTASGFKAELPGMSVEMCGVSRTSIGWNRDTAYSVNARSWTPAGGEYVGDELGRWYEAGTTTAQKPVSDNPPAHGLRYLAFQLTSREGGDVDLTGFVPDNAHAPIPDAPVKGAGGMYRVPNSVPPTFREEDWSREPDFRGISPSCRVRLGAGSPAKYRASVLVENDRADRYFIGIASGPWEKVGVCSSLPSKIDKDFTLSGKWGTVTLDVPRFLDITKPPGPPTVFATARPASEPRPTAFRLTVVDKNGNPISVDRGMPDQTQCLVSEWAKADRIVVEGRRFAYVEFKDVHYYPDGRKWPKVVWGSDGNKCAQSLPGVGRFEGLLKAPSKTGPLEQARVYTPQGWEWAEYPDGRMTLGNGGPEASGRMTALVRLGTRRLRPWDIDSAVFESEGSEPGKGLGKCVTQGHADLFPSPLSTSFPATSLVQVPFGGPANSKYVQIRLRLPDENWKTVGSVPPPKGPFLRRTSKDAEAARGGRGITLTAFSLTMTSKHELNSDTMPPAGAVIHKDKLLQWGSNACQSRLVARLRSGQRAWLSWGSAGEGRTTIEFRIDADSRLICPSDIGPVNMKDVERFELQTRAYGDPVYCVAKLPESH